MAVIRQSHGDLVYRLGVPHSFCLVFQYLFLNAIYPREFHVLELCHHIGANTKIAAESLPIAESIHLATELPAA
jgi:hypothetical protein